MRRSRQEEGLSPRDPIQDFIVAVGTTLYP